LLQSAILAAVTGEDNIGAEIAIAAETRFAAPARQCRIHRHVLAVTRAALDNSGEFMSGHHRSDEPGVADAGFGEPVQVGSAQADGGDADQFLSGGRGRN
jgi:hypothetical protein